MPSILYVVITPIFLIFFFKKDAPDFDTLGWRSTRNYFALKSLPDTFADAKLELVSPTSESLRLFVAFSPVASLAATQFEAIY